MYGARLCSDVSIVHRRAMPGVRISPIQGDEEEYISEQPWRWPLYFVRPHAFRRRRRRADTLKVHHTHPIVGTLKIRYTLNRLAIFSVEMAVPFACADEYQIGFRLCGGVSRSPLRDAMVDVIGEGFDVPSDVTPNPYSFSHLRTGK
jgi:hypothetical protein